MVIKLRRWVKWLILLLLIVVLAVGFLMGNRNYQEMIYPKKYTELVEQYAAQYQVDENLIYAVIKTESGFQPDAVSENNAKGLMQITEDTFHWIGTKLDGNESEQYVHDDLFRPEVNLQYGVFLLSYLIEEFGDYRVVLSAYHAGRGAANQWLQNQEYSSDGRTLQVIPYADTDHYVKKVMKNYQNYQKLYGEN